MDNSKIEKAYEIMTQRFGHDTLISLATIDGKTPNVRIVDSYYENGCFYTITYALSNKVKQIETNPLVAVCGEWFTAHGMCENIGYILDERNVGIYNKLKNAFCEWYDNGHIDESDHNTCIICVHLTDGVLMSNGVRYDINFNAKRTNQV